MTPAEFGEIDHICFALYGFDPSFGPMKNVYDWGVSWFDRLGWPPHKGGVSVGEKYGNYKTFRHLDRKLRESCFGGVTSFELVSIPEAYTARNQWVHRVENMGIAYSIVPLSKYLVFHIQKPLIRNHMAEWLEAAKQACELLRPRYGIGYRRKGRSSQPVMYSSGVLGGGPLEMDDDNATYWNVLRQHEVFKMLRSVYPWNFLTAAQLDLKVGHLRLGDWIVSRDDRGCLSPFTDEVSLWTVPDDRISRVRDELWMADVVLDRKRDFEAKMDEYHVDHNVVAESIKTGDPLIHWTSPRMVVTQITE